MSLGDSEIEENPTRVIKVLLYETHFGYLSQERTIPLSRVSFIHNVSKHVKSDLELCMKIAMFLDDYYNKNNIERITEMPLEKPYDLLELLCCTWKRDPISFVRKEDTISPDSVPLNKRLFVPNNLASIFIGKHKVMLEAVEPSKTTQDKLHGMSKSKAIKYSYKEIVMSMDMKADSRTIESIYNYEKVRIGGLLYDCYMKASEFLREFTSMLKEVVLTKNNHPKEAEEVLNRILVGFPLDEKEPSLSYPAEESRDVSITIPHELHSHKSIRKALDTFSVFPFMVEQGTNNVYKVPYQVANVLSSMLNRAIKEHRKGLKRNNSNSNESIKVKTSSANPEFEDIAAKTYTVTQPSQVTVKLHKGSTKKEEADFSKFSNEEKLKVVVAKSTGEYFASKLEKSMQGAEDMFDESRKQLERTILDSENKKNITNKEILELRVMMSSLRSKVTNAFDPTLSFDERTVHFDDYMTSCRKYANYILSLGTGANTTHAHDGLDLKDCSPIPVVEAAYKLIFDRELKKTQDRLEKTKGTPEYRKAYKELIKPCIEFAMSRPDLFIRECVRSNVKESSIQEMLQMLGVFEDLSSGDEEGEEKELTPESIQMKVGSNQRETTRPPRVSVGPATRNDGTGVFFGQANSLDQSNVSQVPNYIPRGKRTNTQDSTETQNQYESQRMNKRAARVDEIANNFADGNNQLSNQIVEHGARAQKRECLESTATISHSCDNDTTGSMAGTSQSISKITEMYNTAIGGLSELIQSKMARFTLGLILVVGAGGYFIPQLKNTSIEVMSAEYGVDFAKMDPNGRVLTQDKIQKEIDDTAKAFTNLESSIKKSVNSWSLSASSWSGFWSRNNGDDVGSVVDLINKTKYVNTEYKTVAEQVKLIYLSTVSGLGSYVTDEEKAKGLKEFYARVASEVKTGTINEKSLRLFLDDCVTNFNDASKKWKANTGQREFQFPVANDLGDIQGVPQPKGNIVDNTDFIRSRLREYMIPKGSGYGWTFAFGLVDWMFYFQELDLGRTLDLRSAGKGPSREEWINAILTKHKYESTESGIQEKIINAIKAIDGLMQSNLGSNSFLGNMMGYIMVSTVNRAMTTFFIGKAAEYLANKAESKFDTNLYTFETPSNAFWGSVYYFSSAISYTCSIVTTYMVPLFSFFSVLHFGWDMILHGILYSVTSFGVISWTMLFATVAVPTINALTSGSIMTAVSNIISNTTTTAVSNVQAVSKLLDFLRNCAGFIKSLVKCYVICYENAKLELGNQAKMEDLQRIADRAMREQSSLSLSPLRENRDIQRGDLANFGTSYVNTHNWTANSESALASFGVLYQYIMVTIKVYHYLTTLDLANSIAPAITAAIYAKRAWNNKKFFYQMAKELSYYMAKKGKYATQEVVSQIATNERQMLANGTQFRLTY